MGVRFSRANIIDDLSGRIAAVPAAIASVDGDLSVLASQSAEEMKHYIGTRGTAYSQSQGREGRVVTGDMQNDVSFRKIPIGDPTVHIWEFGWVGRFKKYYKFQEEGFNHITTGAVVGMFALKDAATTARERMRLISREILARAIAVIEGK
jgi:hypothetical protein